MTDTPTCTSPTTSTKGTTLYINQGDGTFSEEIEDRTGHISLASMGADMADLSGDGNPEIFVTEMLPETDYRRKTTVQFEDVNLFELKQRRGFFNQYMHNTLQLNNGRGDFTEIAQYSGVEATDWSWGGAAVRRRPGRKARYLRVQRHLSQSDGPGLHRLLFR